MAIQKVLIPFNFTAIDRKALEFGVRTFGGNRESSLTLFHLYIPLPEIETEHATVMGRIKSGMHFLADELRKKEQDLNAVARIILDGGFPEDRLSTVFRAKKKDVADEIVEEVTSGGYQVVILTFRPERITRYFVRSVHNRIMNGVRNVTVCIVT